MQAVLVMFRSDGERRSFSIARDMTVIGRREDCDLRIPLGEISRKHCRLVRDGDLLRLEDLGSSNGTFHNGERIQEVVLNPGDSIQIGPVVFVLQIDGVPADDELHPITERDMAEPDPADHMERMGPLSPTAQSEVAEEEEPIELPEEQEPAIASGAQTAGEAAEEEPDGALILEDPPADEPHHALGGDAEDELGDLSLEDADQHENAEDPLHFDLESDQPHQQQPHG